MHFQCNYTTNHPLVTFFAKNSWIIRTEIFYCKSNYTFFRTDRLSKQILKSNAFTKILQTHMWFIDCVGILSFELCQSPCHFIGTGWRRTIFFESRKTPLDVVLRRYRAGFYYETLYFSFLWWSWFTKYTVSMDWMTFS